ncbi:DUF4335 domain-containing protein [Pleurocapsa sp. CCALA 161]|uniref:DUF4335 domain-containing protein n=1 Tax=Pleurocapsa sp. CCALA 161 TaxID=2107688 RepID=UPI000D07563A|nr:DUF4335 domain-containing protein [Pleurocapsa sp. CCALA 161]PSB12685.1 DUF4335 domain-containing protein [Pleurocapsa sp. CCALA 161]
MSTKRQYSLPSCNLILEGIEDVHAESADILSGQLPMSILINAECHLLKSNQKLSGGSVFLTNLAYAVSNYAQGFLSGLFSADTDKTTAEYPQVSISKVPDQHLHRLTLQPQPDQGEAKTEIDITTVELFDLVDAIDQFYADRSVLPNMTLELKPVSKRYRKPEQPLSERLTPIAIGISSLAFAAGALFMIPVPKTTPTKSAPLDQTTKTQPETGTQNQLPTKEPGQN